MKRMHVHVAVENLDTAIGFYSTLFAAAPTVVKPDYSMIRATTSPSRCATPGQA